MCSFLDKRYYVFLTQNNVLNFVKDDVASNIIQYHKKHNNKGHLPIPKSSLKFKDVEFENKNRYVQQKWDPIFFLFSVLANSKKDCETYDIQPWS